MPQLATVRVSRPGHRLIRVAIPVLPVLVLLSPLVVLTVLAAVVACIVYRINMVRAFCAGWHVIAALPGTRFDIEQDRTAVLVTIR